jgi:hypothetical protein
VTSTPIDAIIAVATANPFRKPAVRERTIATMLTANPATFAIAHLAGVAQR